MGEKEMMYNFPKENHIPIQPNQLPYQGNIQPPIYQNQFSNQNPQYQPNAYYPNQMPNQLGLNGPAYGQPQFYQPNMQSFPNQMAQPQYMQQIYYVQPPSNQIMKPQVHSVEYLKRQKFSTRVFCPHCNSETTTYIVKAHGTATWIWVKLHSHRDYFY